MQTSPIKGFFSILGGKVGLLLLSLLITPLLVRILGSSLYGDYAFILSLLGMSMIIVNAGISDGVRKFVAEDRDISMWESSVFGFYSRIGAFLSGVGAIVFFFANISGFTERFFRPEFETLFYFLGVLIVCRQFFSLVRNSLMAKGLEYISEPLTVVQKISFGVTGLSLALLGYGVEGILIGHIIGTVLGIIIGIYYLRHSYDFSYIFRKLPKTISKQELFSFNLFSVVLIFLTASLYHVDVLLLQPLVGSDKTGYYKAALVVAEFLWFVPNALQTVLLHSASEMWSKNATPDMTMIAARAARYTLVITLLLTIGIAALADPFVTIYYGDEFRPAITPLWLLLPGVLGFAVARPIFAIGQGKGVLKPLIIATGAAAMLNLFLNLFLIPRFGLSGAATATSLGYGSMVWFHVIAARRIGYNPLADLRLSRVLVTVVVTAPVVFGLAFTIPSHVLSLIVVPPAGFMVYFFVAIRSGVITSDELIPFIEQFNLPLSEPTINIIRKIE